MFFILISFENFFKWKCSRKWEIFKIGIKKIEIVFYLKKIKWTKDKYVKMVKREVWKKIRNFYWMGKKKKEGKPWFYVF